nr:F box only protein 30 [Hymenolepis microstoma]CUU99927.1 F box only protein 30 [Hymenolepis microstoma]
MEFFPRYVQKPAAMYTFLCDQDVPRAAYARHTLLHSEAIVQADYWLEQRCPLAYLGCPFSVVRLRPNNTSPPARLAYMPILNAFTVCYTPSVSINEQSTFSVIKKPKPAATTPASLLAAVRNTTTNGYFATSWLDLLPLEVIKKIVDMLDEVSLMNLFRVSPSLGEVCRRTLPTRGIVSPMWQRYKRALGVRGWRIKGFVWSLPRCGEPVHHWRITDFPAPLGTQLTLHLKNDCAFYEALRAHQPFCLYNPAEEKPPFLSGAERQPEYI